MLLDFTQFPDNHLLSEEAADKLGIYVNVAHFVEHNGIKFFRLLTDTDLNRDQITNLLLATIRNKHGNYEFAYLETIVAPIVDQGPRRESKTTYMRVTFRLTS